MAVAITLSPKRLHLLLQAIDAHVVAEDARNQREDPAGDDADDFGNDLWNLKLLRDELRALQSQGAGTARDYECWFDPQDNCLSLLRASDVQRHRDQGLLSDQAQQRYRFIAQTGEEAAAIHALRQGWAPYLPMGADAPCPTCDTPYYPECYSDCWRCGHIG